MFRITNGGSSYNKYRIAAGAASALALAPGAAFALDCSTLPTPIYGIGGSSQKPLVAKTAALLAAAATPLTVVYQSPGACVGIHALAGGTPMTGTAAYWDNTGAEKSCTLPTNGQPAGFAVMGNTAPACPGFGALPAVIGDFVGPVTTYNLIVPKASSQQSISAEAAYFVYGFGQTGQAAPWIDESQIFKRDANSAAQLFFSFATGVPVEKFKGIDTKTNSGTVTSVAQSPTPEAAIGFVSGEVADANRATVRTLAFQAKGQRCSFWPDSTATAFDKKSVRGGQYSVWAPIHFFAKVDGQKHPTDANVGRFVSLLSGVTEEPGVDVLTAEIKSGNIPRCAMSVWRDTDYGDIKKNDVAERCDCTFDFLATGATSCQTCGSNTDCPSTAPVCRRNYCEVK